MNQPGPHLAYELLSSAGCVEEKLERALEAHGLSLAKYKALKQLRNAGEPVPLGSLADRLSCVRSNITQLVDRLEAEKLVLRAGDPNDRRSIRAELTAEGQAKVDQAEQILQVAVDEAFAPIPPERRDEFIAMLRVLRGTA